MDCTSVTNSVTLSSRWKDRGLDKDLTHILVMMHRRKDGLLNPPLVTGVVVLVVVHVLVLVEVISGEVDPPKRPMMISYTPPPTVPAPTIPIRMGRNEELNEVMMVVGIDF